NPRGPPVIYLSCPPSVSLSSLFRPRLFHLEPSPPSLRAAAVPLHRRRAPALPPPTCARAVLARSPHRRATPRHLSNRSAPPARVAAITAACASRHHHRFPLSPHSHAAAPTRFAAHAAAPPHHSRRSRS